jgi:hypothetical protein
VSEVQALGRRIVAAEADVRDAAALRADRAGHGGDLFHRGQARGVDNVRAGVAVGDQARDGVAEVVDAADVVFRPAVEHHRLGQAAGRVSGDGDSLRGDCDVVDAACGRVIVLDGKACRADLGQQRDRFPPPRPDRRDNSTRCRR